MLSLDADSTGTSALCIANSGVSRVFRHRNAFIALFTGVCCGVRPCPVSHVWNPHDHVNCESMMMTPCCIWPLAAGPPQIFEIPTAKNYVTIRFWCTVEVCCEEFVLSCADVRWSQPHCVHKAWASSYAELAVSPLAFLKSPRPKGRYLCVVFATKRNARPRQI